MKTNGLEIKNLSELKDATEYSLHGLKDVISEEKAFRTDFILFIIALLVVGVLRVGFKCISWCESALLIYVVFQILIAEVINTAIETVVDRVSFERHELSRKAKDMGSAIVCLSLIAAGLTWSIVLFGVIESFI